MQSCIVGTAGHIDHGKTELTRALTGINTDRWQEEQARGMTLDLGFAPLELPGGIQASIVDVPGHERLIDNMLAGATGFDVVLFVVAADEGFMPQSQEHLDILQLLGMKRGVVALTKCDKVDAAQIELAKADIAEHAAGTFLEGAPVVETAAPCGKGIDELKEALVGQVKAGEPRKLGAPVRLPVDRVFSMRGAGLVVSGTLSEGVLTQESACRVYPQDVAVRIRELQTHNMSCERVEAGQRVGANIVVPGHNKLARGCVLAEAGSVQVVRRVAAAVQMLESAQVELRSGLRLHVYCGTQQVVGRVRLLEGDVLGPAEAGFAQLNLESDLVVRPQDTLVLRNLSPQITVAGAKVLECGGATLKRNDVRVSERLKKLAGTPSEQLVQRAADARWGLPSIEELAVDRGLSAEEVRCIAEEDVQAGKLFLAGKGYIEASWLEAFERWVDKTLAAYEMARPLEQGMRVSELRQRACEEKNKAAGERVGWLVELVAARKVCKTDGERVWRPGFVSGYPEELDFAHKLAQEVFLHAEFYSQPFSVAVDAVAERGCEHFLAERVLARMRQDEEIVEVGRGSYVGRDFWEQACEVVERLGAEGAEVRLADVRDALEISRKPCQQLLEEMDARGLTRFSDGVRHVLAGRKSAR